MAKFRMVNTRFWEDGYISRLDPTEKLLYLYIITNPHSTLSGIYEIPLRLIAAETGIDGDMILIVFERFSKDSKIRYEDGWIAIKNFKKHHMGGGKDFQAGIDKDLKNAPKWSVDFINEVDSPHTVSASALALAPALISEAKASQPFTVTEDNEEHLGRYKRVPKDKNAELIMKERERKEGRKFTNPSAQMGAIASMIRSDYLPKVIEDEYEYLKKHKFWGKEGVDYLIVKKQIHKEHD